MDGVPSQARIIDGLERGSLFEGPFWAPASGTLYWVDILRGRVFVSTDLRTGAEYWAGEGKVSAAFETGDGRLLMTRNRAIEWIDRSDSSVAALPLAGEPEYNRCNDAKLDPHGNLWVGTMDDEERRESGSIHVVDRTHGLRRLSSGYGICNTFAWDEQARCMYHADSARGVIYRTRCEWEAGGPVLGQREIFLDADAAPGVPDGSALDREGNLWNARWDGGCVICISPAGRILRSLELEARRPTSCAFAGPELEMLVVTTASVGLDVPSPQDGRVLIFDGVAQGARVPLPDPGLRRFAGAASATNG